MFKSYVLLGLAIVCEVIATSALAKSDNFTRLVPSLIVVIGYGAAFWLLSFPIRTIPVGIVYAIWSGMGIVLITMVSWLWFRQTLDVAALLGLALILAGVLVINLFSTSVSH